MSSALTESHLRKMLSDALREHLCSVLREPMKSEDALEDRTLDSLILGIMKEHPITKPHITARFTVPEDPRYQAEKGRTAYDILCSGEIKGIPFYVWINNKYGSIKSKTRNDITTYNNLFRLYFGILSSRLSNQLTIDKEVLRKRISYEEIVSYAVFIVSKTQREELNFFILEEVADPLYINPRNTMFQLPYSPKLRDQPVSFYEFTQMLIDAAVDSLQKAIHKTQAEILALHNLKRILLELRHG